jgi:hypothetical protein
MVDLKKTFRKLRGNNIKLNPKKYVFGVSRDMLLGFIVSECGIKANLEKITTITWMGPIQNVKGVQRIMGCRSDSERLLSYATVSLCRVSLTSVSCF